MSTFLKNFIAIFVLFFIAILFIGYFLPKKDSIIVTKRMNCSPDHIFNQVNTLRNWESWSPWAKLDPNMKMSYNEKPSGAGASYSWEGNKKVGKGTLTILNAIPNQKVELNLSFDGYGDSKSDFTILGLKESTMCDASWSMSMTYSQNSIIKTFFGGYQYLMMKFMIGKDYNQGLENLNNTCSQR